MERKAMEVCYAPVFRKHSLGESIALSVIYYIVIAVLLPLSWHPRISCFVRQCQFFVRFCLRGNDNPRIPL